MGSQTPLEISQPPPQAPSLGATFDSGGALETLGGGLLNPSLKIFNLEGLIHADSWSETVTDRSGFILLPII